jgi:hypothetical protein
VETVEDGLESCRWWIRSPRIPTRPWSTWLLLLLLLFFILVAAANHLPSLLLPSFVSSVWDKLPVCCWRGTGARRPSKSLREKRLVATGTHQAIVPTWRFLWLEVSSSSSILLQLPPWRWRCYSSPTSPWRWRCLRWSDSLNRLSLTQRKSMLITY